MRIESPDFKNGQEIPEEFGCKGREVSPEIDVTGVPAGTESLTLVIDDPDAPAGPFVHWVLFNIPPDTSKITGESAPGVQGKNSLNTNAYAGMCPPSGTHRYFFRLYALDTALQVDPASADRDTVEKAMQGHVIGAADLMGRFTHQ